MVQGKSRESSEIIGEIASTMTCDLENHKESFVFVVGAGASASVRVPTSEMLKEDLTKSFRNEMLSRLNAERAKRTEPSYKKPEDAPLEVLLPIYAKIVGGDNPIEEFLKGHLDRFLGGQVFPPLGYEILAHFMNHGVIKHVVSMNFDELLELALDEELGEQNYEKARSKSQFVKLLDDEQSGFEDKRVSGRKVLLKPHGTISLSATLRVNLSKVFEFEDEKAEVLEKVFARKSLVLVGYRLLDPDMRKIIWRLAQARKLEPIYVVDSDSDFLKENKEVESLLTFLSKEGKRAEDYLIVMKSDEFFRDLGHMLEPPTRVTFLPRIARHEIRSQVFNDGGVSPTPESKLLVELMIFALKVKGKFKTKALLSCERIRHYTRELVMHKLGKTTNVRTILNKLEEHQILNMPEDLTGKVSDVGDEVCYLLGSEGSKSNGSSDITISDETIGGIITELRGILPGLGEKVADSLCSLMKSLYNDFDYDIQTDIHPFEFSFLSPVHKEDPIAHRRTSTALNILKEAGPDKDCYVIAETGEWLTKLSTEDSNVVRGRHNKLKIIISDYRQDPPKCLHRARAERIHKKLSEIYGDTVEIAPLDWNLNRHHGTFTLRGCIYFYKDGKPPSLQPLELTDSGDTKRLLGLCSHLWELAQQNRFTNEVPANQGRTESVIEEHSCNSEGA